MILYLQTCGELDVELDISTVQYSAVQYTVHSTQYSTVLYLQPCGELHIELDNEMLV
jgi:hypothetical protein